MRKLVWKLGKAEVARETEKAVQLVVKVQAFPHGEALATMWFPKRQVKLEAGEWVATAQIVRQKAAEGYTLVATEEWRGA